MFNQKNQPIVFKSTLDYYHDPTIIFSELCNNKTNCLLLESAEIKSKNSLNSLIFIDSALRISCQGNNVKFNAISLNGSFIISLIAHHFHNLSNANEIKLIQIHSKDYLEIHIPSVNENLDEDSKLKALSVLDCLRIIQNIYAPSKTPVYLGGYFAYDLVRNFMPLHEVLADDSIESSDFVFYVAESLLSINHQQRTANLFCYSFTQDTEQAIEKHCQQLTDQLHNLQPIFNAPKKKNNTNYQINENLNDQQFIQIIEHLKEYISNGDIFQIVPSRRFSLTCDNPFLAYQKLKQNNPSPYMFYMQDQQFIIFGASPESALKYSAENNQVEIYPIAGSRPRGFDSNGKINPELDARIELELRLDEKETVEHLMLVDLARNDIARVSIAGSRKVVDLMQIDRYSHIMHLVSRVVGQLKHDLDALHAYQACLNMGTLTGAPKIRAMQLIYQVEKCKRHSYGGAIGYMTSKGDFDTCILIRSAFVQHNIAYVQAGAGLVLDSNPQAEAHETRIKARAVLLAIKSANQS